jgi:tetratricopeptide (TPR) repeat protein
MPGYFSKLIFVLVVFYTLAAFTNGSAQVARKATDKPAESKPAPRRPERPRVRRPVTSTSPATTESDQFLNLGERFRKDGKWNAAEAAYRESIKVWPSNADAFLELGFLYIDRNRLPEAQAVYSKLRAVNSSFAAELLADINRYKAASR